MKKSLLLLFFLLFSLLLAGTASAVPVVATGTQGTDGFTDWIVPGWNIQNGFVAEGRIGDNNGTAGTHEIDFGINTSNSSQFDAANRSYTSGTFYDFSLDYNGLNNLSKFTIGDTTVEWTFDGFTDEFDGLVIRAATDSRSRWGNTTISFTDLVLDGYALGSFYGNDPTKDDGRIVNWLTVANTGDLSDGFDLTGQVALSWDGTGTPTQSNLAFQIKGANAPSPVPEPATMLLLGTGLVGLAGMGRRKLKKK